MISIKSLILAIFPDFSNFELQVFCHFWFFGPNFFLELQNRSKCPTKIFFILIGPVVAKKKILRDPPQKTLILGGVKFPMNTYF